MPVKIETITIEITEHGYTLKWRRNGKYIEMSSPSEVTLFTHLIEEIRL